MSKYKFETADFGLSDDGVHLLRSRFNYETISFQQVEKLRIEKSRIVNNWLLLLLMGVGLIVFSVYYTFVLIDVFNDDSIRRIYIEEILVPFLPFLAGAFMVVSALRNGLIMVVKYQSNRTKRLPLIALQKAGTLNEFVKELEMELKKTGQPIELAAFELHEIHQTVA